MGSRIAKGARFELAVQRVLRDAGVNAQRVRPCSAGGKSWVPDEGDVHTPDLPIAWQCKDHGKTSGAIRTGVDQAQEQARNAGKPYGVAVVRRLKKPVEEAYVAMPLRSFVELVKELAANDEDTIRVEYRPGSALKAALKQELQQLDPAIDQAVAAQSGVASPTCKAKALVGLLMELEK